MPTPKIRTKKQKPLGTIEEEAAACRKAFVKSKTGDIVWHCHHGQGVEGLAMARGRWLLSGRAASSRKREAPALLRS